MLVLTRRPGESIIIGKHLIKVKVLNSNGYSVRIGIEAPKELSVHREEIYHCIENGNGDQHERPKREPIKREISGDLGCHVSDDETKFNR